MDHVLLNVVDNWQFRVSNDKLILMVFNFGLEALVFVVGDGLLPYRSIHEYILVLEIKIKYNCST